ADSRGVPNGNFTDVIIQLVSGVKVRRVTDGDITIGGRLHRARDTRAPTAQTDHDRDAVICANEIDAGSFGLAVATKVRVARPAVAADLERHLVLVRLQMAFP